MPITIRAAAHTDLPRMTDLLLIDANNRRDRDPILWAISDDARHKVEKALTFALGAEEQPFRQQWLVAEAHGRLVGMTHSMMLPVPPIYAGLWGDPGLVLEDCIVEERAPPETFQTLMEATETDLLDAGAELLLASSVLDGSWQKHFANRGYEPLTLYFSKTGIGGHDRSNHMRSAVESDVPAIVERSAEHRKNLAELDRFWTPHAEANARFESWMKRSLTLADRDMFVANSGGSLGGYVIAQPASALHFPPAHETKATGAIDDYYHTDFSNPLEVLNGGRAATVLLQAAEAALAGRGCTAAFIVCPAAWRSKIAILENAGYKTAMVWMIKR